MPFGAPKEITECRRFFLEPQHPKQRQYEALRRYFLDQRPSKEVAASSATPKARSSYILDLGHDQPTVLLTNDSRTPKTLITRYAQRMRGYAECPARQIFRDLVDMPADVTITESEVQVRFHRRAHLPIIAASGFTRPAGGSAMVEWNVSATGGLAALRSPGTLGKFFCMEIQASQQCNPTTSRGRQFSTKSIHILQIL